MNIITTQSHLNMSPDYNLYRSNINRSQQVNFNTEIWSADIHNKMWLNHSWSHGKEKKKRKRFDLNYDNNVMEKMTQDTVSMNQSFTWNIHEISRWTCSNDCDKNKSSHSQL